MILQGFFSYCSSNFKFSGYLYFKHYTLFIYTRERLLQRTGTRAGEMLICVVPVKDYKFHHHQQTFKKCFFIARAFI